MHDTHWQGRAMGRQWGGNVGWQLVVVAHWAMGALGEAMWYFFVAGHFSTSASSSSKRVQQRSSGKSFSLFTPALTTNLK